MDFDGFRLICDGFAMDFDGFRWILIDFDWFAIDFDGFRWISMDFDDTNRWIMDILKTVNYPWLNDFHELKKGGKQCG